MKILLNLGKILNKTEQKTINGGANDCGIFTCGPGTDGCLCFNNEVNSDQTVGTCLNGVCCD